MLSILIPTYNYPINNLVNTVYKQCQTASISFEIIVADDFSSNLEIRDKNSEIENLKNCVYLKNKKNIGRTATRNLLAETAKYNLLLFLDADVLPRNNDFITRFNLTKNKDCQVIYGGVSYYKSPPEKHKILRWKYGHKREAKDTNERIKTPYFIISQNLLIQKDIFLKVNSVNTNAYGLDILFSNNLKKNSITVNHINNPVYHLGLEPNDIFIKKSLEAVRTTIKFEEKGLLANDLRPLQKSYLTLKKNRLIPIFSFIISKLKNKMERNFKSANPNLFWFDLYRLQYYIELKSKKNG